MKRIFKYALITIVVLVAAFLIVSYALEFCPAEVESVEELCGRDRLADNLSYDATIKASRELAASFIIPDTLKIMSWNIGYAGLGDNMDFYMDGGGSVRDSKERTDCNFAKIITELKKENADIYLLQEVDLNSRRTYRFNQVKALADAFPDYKVYFAPNFKVWFVPDPLKEPIGSVHSGLLMLTRITPVSVWRVQYPSSFSFPVRMFNLKRCLLEADFMSKNCRILHIGNTHNTAFDTGGMRTLEDGFLKERIASFDRKGEGFLIAGDYNQCPPQHRPTPEEIDNEFFHPEIFDTAGIDSFARIACDTLCPTMRYNDRPYDPLTSTTSLLDFFLLSRAYFNVLDMHALDLKFHSSDHNPVILTLTAAF